MRHSLFLPLMYTLDYTKITFVLCVTYKREVTGSYSTLGKNPFFSASVDLDVTTDSPLTQLAMAPASDYSKPSRIRLET